LCRLSCLYSFAVLGYNAHTRRGEAERVKIREGMARRGLNRLSDRGARTLGPGLQCDGGGLYLQVSEPASLRTSTAISSALLNRSWLFCSATTEAEHAANAELGRGRWMGLGRFPEVGVAEARQKAADARRLREQGVDAHRNAQQATAAASQAKTITFEKAAEKCVASQRRHGAAAGSSGPTPSRCPSILPKPTRRRARKVRSA
jgi:hypothetical protein